MQLKQPFTRTFFVLALIISTISLSFAQTTPTGKSVFYDGVDDYIEFPFSTGANSPQLTIEAWIKPCDINGIITIASKRDLSPPNDNYSFSINNGRLRWVFRENGNSGNSANIVETIPVVVSAGVWQHVAVVHDASVQRAFFYVDGQLVDPNNDVSYTGVFHPLGNAGGTIKLGITPTSVGNFLFNGNMDEVTIWGTARNQSLIQDDMNGVTPFSISNNVLVYLDMEVDAAGSGAILPNAGTMGLNDGRMKNWLNPTATNSPFTILNQIDVCCLQGGGGQGQGQGGGKPSDKVAPSFDIENSLQLAPNPNLGSFRVSWPASSGTTGTGIIKDLVTGQIVYQGAVERDQLIDLPEGATGTMVISVVTEKGEHLSARLVSRIK